MKTSSYRIYSIVFIIFFVIGLVYLALHEKGDFYLWVNSHHTPFADVFFKYATYLGDGVWFAFIAIGALFFSYFKGTTIAVSGLVQLVVIQGMKRKIFPSNPRPAEYFKEMDGLHFVAGVDVHHWNSFPSGHTATAFGLAMLLVLLYNPSKVWTYILFLIAVLVGFSRIYLSQHFLQDVIVGAMIGSLISILIYRLMQYIKSRSDSNNGFYSKSIISLFKKSN